MQFNICSSIMHKLNIFLTQFKKLIELYFNVCDYLSFLEAIIYSCRITLFAHSTILLYLINFKCL